jgi:WD40 repeat protein
MDGCTLAGRSGTIAVFVWLLAVAPLAGQGKKPSENIETVALRVDRSGDALPAEATARLGTLRFRHALGFSSVAYTPDGRHLVTGGWGGACLWDAVTGQRLRSFGEELPNPTRPAGLSPDGKFVAVGGWGPTEAAGGAVYEVATGRRLYGFGAASASVTGCFSPDGKCSPSSRAMTAPLCC